MIFRILSTVRFNPTFDLQKDFSGICGELKSCRSSSLLSVAARIRSIRYLCKKLWQKYWNSAGCFHIRIFPILAWMNFFFSSLFHSHTFLTYLTLQKCSNWSWPLNSLEPVWLAEWFNLLQKKITHNEYIFENYFELTYLHVIKHEINVIFPTKTKIIV